MTCFMCDRMASECGLLEPFEIRPGISVMVCRQCQGEIIRTRLAYEFAKKFGEAVE